MNQDPFYHFLDLNDANLLNDKYENDTNNPDSIQKNETSLSNFINARQTIPVLYSGTLKLKVIFNKNFVCATGSSLCVCSITDCGTEAGARSKAIEIVDKVNSYYTTEFSASNRLSTSISITLDGGKKKRFLN